MSAEQLLGAFEESSDTIVIADLEAGIGSLTRMAQPHVDQVIVVCEPTVKSIQAASRAVEQAERLGVPVVIAANRVTTHADEVLIADAFPGLALVAIPDDERIVDSDRLGVAPIDHAPNCPAVRAIYGMVAAL